MSQLFIYLVTQTDGEITIGVLVVAESEEAAKMAHPANAGSAYWDFPSLSAYLSPDEAPPPVVARRLGTADPDAPAETIAAWWTE